MDNFSKKKLWYFGFLGNKFETNHFVLRWFRVQSRIFMNDSSFERFYFYTNYPGKKRIIKVDKTKKTFRDEKNEIDNFGIMTSFYSIRQLGCILSTFMHRRHLMVWNVFAPRLLFEIAEFLVFLIFCFLILSTNVSIICPLEKRVSFSSASKILVFFLDHYEPLFAWPTGCGPYYPG